MATPRLKLDLINGGAQSSPIRASSPTPAVDHVVSSWAVPHPHPVLKGHKLQIGVIGYGYWGPNVVRNFQAQEHSQVAVVCDSRPEALAKVAKAHPHMEVT